MIRLRNKLKNLLIQKDDKAVRSFTLGAYEVARIANEIRSDYGHKQIIPAHILLAMFHYEGSLASQIIEQLGIKRKVIEGHVNRILTDYKDPYHLQVTEGDTIYYSLEVRNILEVSQAEAKEMGDSLISEGHLLIAMMHKRESNISKIFGDEGLDQAKIKAMIEKHKRWQRSSGEGDAV